MGTKINSIEGKADSDYAKIQAPHKSKTESLQPWEKLKEAIVKSLSNSLSLLYSSLFSSCQTQMSQISYFFFLFFATSIDIKEYSTAVPGDKSRHAHKIC